MINTRTIPYKSLYDLVTFDVLSEGQKVPGEVGFLSISIEKEVNRIPTARLVIRDGKAADSNFEESNADYFEPGKKIEIRAGRDCINETIFKGIITKQCIKAPEFSNSYLVVECKDETVKMTVGRHNKYYTESKDSEVIEEVLSKYQLTGDIESTDVEHKEMIQHHVTDWDFIMSRAERNGKLILVEDGKVNMKTPNSNQEEIVTLTYGATLLNFEAEMDARHQWKTVNAKSWDYSSQQLFEAETSATEFKSPGDLSGAQLSEVIDLDKYDLRHSGRVLQEELQAWTDASFIKSRLSKIRGRAKFTGFSGPKPGVVINFQGVGARFNGKAYITGVRHVLENGNWYIHAQLGLSSDWFAQKEDVVELPAAGLIPAIHGLQIGKVVQLQNDPDGEDRILVKLPIIDNEAQGIWARVASIDAGENRGAFFRPEIDDEVIIGFVNDDPRDAVVLGMLNSSAKPAPLIAQDDNHEKGFVTRSEMKMLFNDDKKIITIETPAGNSFVISEEDTSIILTDQNNNKTTMNADGISLESPKDIVLKAQGNISIEATKNVDIKGMNITASANIQFTAEGGGAGTLGLSAAQGELKAPMIMIN